MRHTSVVFVTARAKAACVVALIVSVGLSGCRTARGLVDEGKLRDACLVVERAPSPVIDDDPKALASRIRHKLPGTVRVRAVPHAELTTIAGVPVGEHPAFLEVTANGDGVLSLREITLVDEVGTRFGVTPANEALLLAMTGAPPPPAPIVHTSTHTPGPFEALIKGVAIAVIGIPLAIGTFGIISPDLGGALSPSATTTSTWQSDSPELAAWRERPDVQGAAKLAVFAGAAQAPCAGGRCRVVVPVARPDAWKRAELRLVLGVQDCALDDVIEVPLGVEVALKDTAADTGQWGRFWDEAFGLRPILEDVGDACDGCRDCVGNICF